MGVQHLWSILEQCKRTESVEQLRDKTLCIDLSLWICEAQGTRGLKDQLKPYLRNVFFRTMFLASIGVHPVFVVDGIPPEIKRETIMKRLQARKGIRGGERGRLDSKSKPKKLKRSKFNIWCDECCEMFRFLGIPFVKSEGEAEATCAWMNKNKVWKLVDGVLTDDGDVFLYGAQVVYKDFNISSSKPLTDCLQVYYMEDIEESLGLNQRNMIALGLLLGCDYVPAGVPGIGKETAVKLLSTLRGTDLLKRFEEWKESPSAQPECYTSLEVNVKRKAVKIPNFPEKEVISEFLSPKVGNTKVDITWKYPDMEGIKEFFSRKLEWPKEYTEEKMFNLGSDWQLASDATVFIPTRVVKARIKQKVECLEIEWQTLHAKTNWPERFTSIKTKEIMHAKHPMLVEYFEKEVVEKKSKPKGKPRKASRNEPVETPADDLSDLLSKMKDVDLNEKTDNNVRRPTDTYDVARTTATNSKEDALYEVVRPISSQLLPSLTDSILERVTASPLDISLDSDGFEVRDSAVSGGFAGRANNPSALTSPDHSVEFALPAARSTGYNPEVTSPNHSLQFELQASRGPERTSPAYNLVDITIDQSFGNDASSLDNFLSSSFVSQLKDLSTMDLFSPAIMSSRVSTPQLAKTLKDRDTRDIVDIDDSDSLVVDVSAPQHGKASSEHDARDIVDIYDMDSLILDSMCLVSTPQLGKALSEHDALDIVDIHDTNSLKLDSMYIASTPQLEKALSEHDARDIVDIHDMGSLILDSMCLFSTPQLEKASSEHDARDITDIHDTDSLVVDNMGVQNAASNAKMYKNVQRTWQANESVLRSGDRSCTPLEESSLASRLLKRFQDKNSGITNTLRLLSSTDDTVC